MAFSNLFTQLCDLERTVKDPSRRNEFKSGRGCSSKRKPQTMQTGPHVKWRCLQPYAADVSDAVRNEDPKAPEDQRFNWANNNPRPGVSSDNYQYTENADNTHKKKKKKNKGKKWRENSARYRKAKREPRKPLMSKEFKAQHSMEVDGRLLCIYFLRGKCIKGEECQFEHIEGYNGLIKAACKFYIQGFCLKGKNCPYLHETFPCKFFHTQGICRRDQCMFSHDPLTDFTRKLLDDFIQQENERVELRKKAEEEALERADNMSEVVEENKTVLDIIIPTARPSFYQSSAVEKEAVISDEEQPAEEDNTPQTHNNVEPDVSLSSAVEQPGSVCYSVEAMLGPKLFKPCLYTATKSQEAPASESKTPDNPLDVIDCPYSIASVLKSSIRSSDLHSPSIAPAVVASSESNYKETTLILDNKYAFFPSIQEKPPSFYDSAASQYHNNQYEKTTFWGKFKAKGELTVGLSTLEDEKITTKKREYMPLIKSHCPSQVQKDKFDECDLKLSQFKDKPFLKSDTFLSKPLPTNQGTSVQQNPKGNDRKTSLKNFDYNKQERIASPCVKTLRLNRLFGSLSTAADWTSTVINSVCGNQAVQSAQKYESDGAGQKFHSSEEKKQSLFSGNTSENSKNGCSSKNKREEIERDEISPPKKCHRLFASLTPDFSGKPAVQSARKPICHSEKIKCGSKQATKPSPIPRNTSESTGNISKKLVCTSSTANLKCSKQKEDIESAKTPPAKSTSTVCNSFSEKPSPQNDIASKTPPAKPFQSLFASPIPDSNRTSAVCKGFIDKRAVPSHKKVDTLKSGSNKASKPRQFSHNSSESRNDSSTSKQTKLVSTSATANIYCSNNEEDIEFAKTPAKSLQRLFTSLTPHSDRASTVSNSLSEKTALQSAQKSEKSIGDCQTSFAENTSESPNNSHRMQVDLASRNSQGLKTSPATSKLKDTNTKEDAVSAKTPPAKPFQSLFASLTPESNAITTVRKQFSDKTAVQSSQKCETPSGNTSESTNTTTKNNLSEKAVFKCSKQKEDVERAKTPPSMSIQSIFASLTPDSAQTSFSDKPDVPSAQRVEKSSCDSQKVNCGSSQTLKPIPFTENTPKSPNSGYTMQGASTKTRRNSSPGLITSPATSKLKGTKTPPAKPFQSIFASLTPESNQTPIVCKTAAPSPRKCEKSICAKLNCGSNLATKRSPFTVNTSESTNNISTSNPSKLLVCTSASDSVNCSKREEDNGSAKTPAKPFQSLFTSLNLDSDQALNTNSSFSEKTAVPRVQKVDKSICDGRASTVCNGQNFASAFGSSDLKSENQEEDVESVETPIKSFQSLFASLTRTFGKNIKPDALSYEKAKCDGQNSTSDSNRAKSTTRQSHFPENVSQSPNNANGGRGDVAVAAESTDRLSNSGQNSAASNLKSKNRKDDTDGSARAIQSLFTCLTPEVDRTLTVQPQKVEKSICGNQKFKCDSSQRQSQYNESATGIKCPKPFSSSAMRSNSKEENRDIGSANTPAKSFHHLFSAPLDESAATNDSKMPFLPQSVEGQLSNTKRTSSHASNTENKRTGQSRSATVNSPNVSHETPANPQHQSNNGSPNSIFKSLFQQLNP